MSEFVRYAAALDRVARDALAEAGARFDTIDDATSALVGRLLQDDRETLAEAVDWTRSNAPEWFRRPAPRP